MRYKIKPIKRLGQNFLIDKQVIKKVIRTANLHPKDIVLEIGPGTGVLTQEIAKTVKKVIAVEKDPRMCEVLKENLKDFKNVEVVNKDVLELIENCSRLVNREQFSIIANLPFYITAPVIRKFLEAKNPPKEMILIIQKEVAQRICSKPPKTNLLAISVQFYANVKIISYVSKKSFRPVPKVDSAIIKITPHINCAKLGLAQNKDKFFEVVKAGFSHPRKQLANNLANGLKLNKKEINNLLLKNNIRPTRRAETLIVQDWINLFNSIHNS